ncbi:hypothetical protein PVAND_001690 [Polypedilum vanderplanki]|uniref:Integrase catalytic domain-containing protein n=1 Tax=Polypedilum vanderplanki TaxID=319348 RepID=A0A9J6BP54_POLVA|nr:hypothetical protein PVAND_001690 [Polypedilum vanderplanki]
MTLPEQSLAITFKDKKVLDKWIKENPGSELISSYIFRCNQVQSDFKCASCELDIPESEGNVKINKKETLNGKDYFIWCISCNDIDHLACLGLKSLSDTDAPWTCAECKSEPANEAALDLVQNKKYLQSFTQRKEYILKSTISPEEREIHVYFSDYLQVEMIAGYPKLQQVKERFQDQQKEMETLGQRLKEANKKIAELQETVDSQVAELAVFRAKADKSSNDEKSGAPARKFRGLLRADDFENGSPISSTMHAQSHRSYNRISNPFEQTLEALEKIDLHNLRRILPNIEKFDGDPRKWLNFERQVNLIQTEGVYSGQYMKHIIRDKLKGRAADLAERLFDSHTYEQIMLQLKRAFGDPKIVLDAQRKQVQNIKLPTQLTHAAIVDATTVISGYLQACKQAKVTAHDRSLAMAVFNQLDARYCEDYYKFFRDHYPYDTREEKLDVLLEFLDTIRDTLPIGSFSPVENRENRRGNSFQVQSVSSTGNARSNASSSQVRDPSRHNYNNKDRTEAYIIRDIKFAAHQGYYLDKVQSYPAQCQLCNQNGHYTVECKAFKRKSVTERQQFVDSKSLCHSCIISSDHTASQCQLKKHCGARIAGRRCKAAHHIMLHTKNNSQIKSNRSMGSKHQDPQSNASSSYQGFPVENSKAGQNAIFSQGFVVLTASQSAPIAESSPRTIKAFRTFVEFNGRRAAAFAVGDSAAEVSLVKRSLVDALGITGPPAVIGIQWTDESTKSIMGIKVDLPIRGILPDSKEFVIKNCFAIDDFNLPARTLNVEQLKKEHPHLQAIPFESYVNMVPAILLGTSHASLYEAIAPLFENGDNKPVGILTKLGYSIFGCSSTQNDSVDVLNAIASDVADEDDSNYISNEELSHQLEFYNSLDSLHLKPVGERLTVDEKSAIAQAEKGLVHLPNGFIQMPLIWRLIDGKKPKLIDNFPMVLRRQLAQERKLQKNPELLEAFNNNFKKEIDEGYIRAATARDMQTTGMVNYVPMSLVVNANKRPVKTRNVYDASAKYKGDSLNANLLPGPNLLIDLLKPIMRMREKPIAFTGDIKSMFNRILIHPDDQNCQRLLWRADTSQPMQIFIKKSMLFGPSSSPFVSQFVKNWIADTHKQQYPEASQSIKEDVYMDDWLTSFSTVEEAIARLKEGIAIFASAQMQLVGIQSNNASLLSSVPDYRIKKEMIPLMSDSYAEYVSKVLGINWDTTTDSIVFELNDELLKDKFLLTGIKPTKREQCSLIARIFDVLGLLAHCIIRARILLQHSFKNKIEWDQEITDEDAILWSQWLVDLKKASKVQIPRCRSSLDSLADAESLELHTFSDAGQEAFAAVSYLVVLHNKQREPSFIMAKSKVAPIKLKSNQEVTEMPRLELLGALIGARLAAHITKLHSHLKLKKFFWCDSEVVLRWIWNTNLKLPRFAVSPVSEILEISEISQWKYVDTKCNVADLATKFQSHEFGNSHSVWYTGPDFLKLEPDHWPTQTFTVLQKEQAVICTHQLANLDPTSSILSYENPLELLPKLLPPYDCHLMSLTNKETGEVQNSAIMNQLAQRKPSIYYSWPKLVRATARALLFRNEIIVPLLKEKKWRSRTGRKVILAKAKPKFQLLSPEYISAAELFLVRYMQRQAWPTEIEALQKGQRINNKELLDLNVFLDHDKVLRIRSRVALPYCEYPQKYAPVIPRLKERDSLTKVLLRHYHNMFRHVCVEAQIAEFRSKYWMTGVREWLKKLGYSCNLCIYNRCEHKAPKMADLPMYRVDRKLNPFEVVGLDCCGPFRVSENDEIIKIWVLLFTCTVTRFVHLEILRKIDTNNTLAAITSAYAAHGPIVRLISDNGTNFVGACNVLFREQEYAIEELKKCVDSVNQHYISQLKEFRWEFIPVKAAWFGGFYERLVGEFKRGMKSEIGTKDIPLLVFKIAMNESAHRLNCRPLTHLPVSHEEEDILTPHHLAKNKPGWPLLPSAHNFKDLGKPIDQRAIYVEGQKLADKITRRFYKQYLPDLAPRRKWNKDQPPLKIGDLVLIIDPSQTRSQWTRGIIQSLRLSGDGVPRSAEVKTAYGIKKPAIQHIAKIDIVQA